MKAALLSTSANQGRVPPKSRNERQKAVLLKGGCDLIRAAAQAWAFRRAKRRLAMRGASLRQSYLAGDVLALVSTEGEETARYRIVNNTLRFMESGSTG